MTTSKHYATKRYKREQFIKKVLKGDGNIIDSFEIDRGHKDGVEIHSITDKGLIIIHNKESGKLITKLIARPMQIKRYYIHEGRYPPKWLIKIAIEHTRKHYNRD